MRLSDCAFEIMRETGQQVSWSSPECITIYNLWLLFQKNPRPAAEHRKRNAVMSMMGKDKRFVNIGAAFASNRGVFLLAGYDYKQKKFLNKDK